MDSMREFYTSALGLKETSITGDKWLLEGPSRRLLLSKGTAKKLSYTGFCAKDDAQLIKIREFIVNGGGTPIDNPSPLIQQGGFAVRDPDDNVLCFGVSNQPSCSTAGLDGRLQHVVVATGNLQEMMKYYQNVLGFLPSDVVKTEEGRVTAAFYRSNPEHHSFAAFAADEPGFDHFAFETPSWNHIRDWADHLAKFDIPIWWGPGRHGAGNNLFFMVLDPDGNKIEISAELELMDWDHPLRYWPHDRRTLNLWGNAWMRS
tara:strand:- start:158 stop:937 length:780 start_codon:yes stop_codon:yes gene_type:complete